MGNIGSKILGITISIEGKRNMSMCVCVCVYIYMCVCVCVCVCVYICASFPGSSDSKASAYNAGDLGSIPTSERSAGEGNSNPLQYSCLENPMDRGAW